MMSLIALALADCNPLRQPHDLLFHLVIKKPSSFISFYLPGAAKLLDFLVNIYL